MTEERARCGVPVLADEIDARCSHLRRGWYWGTQVFAERMLRTFRPGLTKARSRAFASAPERRAHDEYQARQWLGEGLAAAGLTAADLPQLKSTDPRKAALAALLWRHTTVSQSWLAERLHLRSAANVSQLLRRSAPQDRARSRMLPVALREFVGRIRSGSKPQPSAPSPSDDFVKR